MLTLNDLSQNIKDSFDAIEIILVFIFVLFDIRYPKIVKDINADIPIAERIIARKQHHEKLIHSFLINSLPLIFINGFILYLLLPLVVQVFLTSKLDLWNFDFLRTSLILVFIFIFIFFTWSLYLGIKYLGKIRECK